MAIMKDARWDKKSKIWRNYIIKEGKHLQFMEANKWEELAHKTIRKVRKDLKKEQAIRLLKHDMSTSTI